LSKRSSDPAAYNADHDGSPYPSCELIRGDVNTDGLVDGADINTFVGMLLNE
jgi:hypothetical protein